MKRHIVKQEGSRFGACVRSAALLLAASGCASIVHGTSQDLTLAVQPAQSSVSVYRLSGERVAGPGVSPGTLEVQRPKGGQSYLILATKPGHCPTYIVTKMGASSSATQGNLLLGGVVGVSVDMASGAAYAIDPPSVTGTLLEDSQCQ